VIHPHPAALALLAITCSSGKLRSWGRCVLLYVDSVVNCDSFRLGRFTVCGWRFLPFDHLPYGLPLQATESQLHDEDLPPQHQRQRVHLSGYPQGPMVASADHIERWGIYSLTQLYRALIGFHLPLFSLAFDLLDAY
jgi:hypothetical protein